MSAPLCEIFFGGPDLPPNRLRDLLAERISAVPAGGTIDWVTYYFRDRPLAEELLKAHRRGVKVNLTLEEMPRTGHANEKVINILSGPDGLGNGLSTLSMPKIPALPGIVWKPHLHEKLYCFSHPEPVAFVGSFNPSGDGPEDDQAIIAEIGDQDRGHNFLVGFHDAALVTKLVEHSRWMHRGKNILLYRFGASANSVVKGFDTDIYFWPRIHAHPVLKFLSGLGADAHIRIAASHIKGTPVVNAIKGLARNGAHLEIRSEATHRRVPVKVERMFRKAGIPFRRVIHPEGLPMHYKFVLAEKDGQSWVAFGSFNWTIRSCWLNHEIGAISSNEKLFNSFADRWDVL